MFLSMLNLFRGTKCEALGLQRRKINFSRVDEVHESLPATLTIYQQLTTPPVEMLNDVRCGGDIWNNNVILVLRARKLKLCWSR